MFAAEAELFPEGDLQPSGLTPTLNGRAGPPAAGRPAAHTQLHPHRHPPALPLLPLSPLTALLHGAAAGIIREGALRHDRPPPPLMLPLSQVRNCRSPVSIIHTIGASLPWQGSAVEGICKVASVPVKEVSTLPLLPEVLCTGAW